jgi:predicted Holliday junction resolvase-like endonuclease
MIDLGNPQEIKRIQRKIEELIKWAQEVRKEEIKFGRDIDQEEEEPPKDSCIKSARYYPGSH